MIGHYVTGNDKAHLYTPTYEHYFNCPIIGTFNVKIDGRINDYRPCIVDEQELDRRFWVVRINDKYFAWAVRWRGSKMPYNIIELVSKMPLPDDLKEGDLSIEVLEPLIGAELQKWISQQTYWFQSFSWSPQRADSALVWNAVKDHVDWSGKTLLDIGGANGAHCFPPSRLGARVTCFEPDTPAREKGMFINDHIEMCDVTFCDADSDGVFDVIFYFSVHHQWDEAYSHLAETLAQFKNRAREKVFVELIVPDLTNKLTELQIDAIVGGQPLLTYRHKVRRVRRIYELIGEAE